MSDLSGEPRGEPRSEDAALQELSRRMAKIGHFADHLHETLPAPLTRHNVCAYVRYQLHAILDGKET